MAKKLQNPLNLYINLNVLFTYREVQQLNLWFTFQMNKSIICMPQLYVRCLIIHNYQAEETKTLNTTSPELFAKVWASRQNLKEELGFFKLYFHWRGFPVIEL